MHHCNEYSIGEDTHRPKQFTRGATKVRFLPSFFNHFHRFYLFLTTLKVLIFFIPNLYFTSFMSLSDSLLINQIEASNNGFSRDTKVELMRLGQGVKEDFQRFDLFYISLFCLIYFQCFLILALDPLIFGLTVSGYFIYGLVLFSKDS